MRLISTGEAPPCPTLPTAPSVGEAQPLSVGGPMRSEMGEVGAEEGGGKVSPLVDQMEGLKGTPVDHRLLLPRMDYRGTQADAESG